MTKKKKPTCHAVPGQLCYDGKCPQQLANEAWERVADFKRALRHMAHVYCNTTHSGPVGEDKVAEDLYRAARALAAAELIATQGEVR